MGRIHGVPVEETLRRCCLSWDDSPIYPNISHELITYICLFPLLTRCFGHEIFNSKL